MRKSMLLVGTVAPFASAASNRSGRNGGKLSFGAAAVAGIWLSIFSGPFTTANAQYQGTPEMQQSCTPDVMRLCNAEVLDVARITVCMKRNRANLTPTCDAAAFDAGNRHKRLRHLSCACN
jgi:hypothetical protein